jgi:hypothetical protein
MSGFSDYSAQATINYWLLGTAMPTVSNRYLAVFTADPKDDNSGVSNEVSGSWYARQVANSWTAPVSNVDGTSGTVTKNSAQISFAAVTGSSVTVTHWGLYDAATGGHLLYSGALTTSKSLNVSDVLTLASEQLVMTWL